MPETLEPIQEVWITDNTGKYRRVYRGRNHNHVKWKMDYHTKEGNKPAIEAPGEGSAILPRGWKKP